MGHSRVKSLFFGYVVDKNEIVKKVKEVILSNNHNLILQKILICLKGVKSKLTMGSWEFPIKEE